MGTRFLDNICDKVYCIEETAWLEGSVSKKVDVSMSGKGFDQQTSFSLVIMVLSKKVIQIFYFFGRAICLCLGIYQSGRYITYYTLQSNLQQIVLKPFKPN
jgi:hypothetical protein